MTPETLRIGAQIELDIQNVANGGFCIARHDGKVVFVRHSLPGERVIAEITDITSKFLRADAVEVVQPSPDRITAPCPYVMSCGGCDWQHANLPAQRRLKSEVVIEQLGHLGKVTQVNGAPLGQFQVEPLLPSETGFGWRTRNRFAALGDFGIGMRISRSHSVVEIDDCLIATEGAADLAREALHLGQPEIQTALSSTGQHVVVNDRGGPFLDEQVEDRRWRIHADSFWQVHREAPKVLVETVRSFASLRPGDSLLDLYSGAGLFAACLSKDVGETGTVVAVESAINAVRDARRSCSDLPQLELVTADVTKWVNQNADQQFDVVVLDPPRAGAGAKVIAQIAEMANRAIVYVSCDPSSLGRDTGLLADLGWSLRRLRGFDAFPMTHHIECVAVFVPAQA